MVIVMIVLVVLMLNTQKSNKRSMDIVNMKWLMVCGKYEI